jgi:nucleotide-binding universal stress UspA family protein
MREAVAHQVPLTVMAVHAGSPRPATQIYWNVPTLPEGSPDPELARTAVRKWVDTVADEDALTVPEVIVEVRTGDPAEELVSASRDADLLVVGSRGSGVWAQILLGSVSSKVVHHAASPSWSSRGTARRHSLDSRRPAAGYCGPDSGAVPAR